MGLAFEAVQRDDGLVRSAAATFGATTKLIVLDARTGAFTFSASPAP